jgi:DNA-binding NarL/FixJ family response regulator
MSRTTVLLADDHCIVADGLASLLRDQFDLVGVVADGNALVESAMQLCPDVIVADITMPGINGLEAARRLAVQGCTSRIVFLTMHDDPQLVAEAFRAGASAYVLKQSAGDELLTAIREVMKGHAYLTPLITRDVMHALIPRHPPPRDAQSARLTARQIDVLRLIARGKRPKEIAVELGLSARTVESHKYDMMQTLGISTTAELVHYAIRSGVLGRELAEMSAGRNP